MEGLSSPPKDGFLMRKTFTLFLQLPAELGDIKFHSHDKEQGHNLPTCEK